MDFVWALKTFMFVERAIQDLKQLAWVKRMNVEEIVSEMEKNDIHINDVIQHKNEFSLIGDNQGKRQHVCIGIAINREITAESFTSLMQLYGFLNRNFSVSFTTSIATYLHEGRALILKNMSDINKQAPIDYLLWIDSDMVYTTKDFEKLKTMMDKKNLDVLSALYFTKRSRACKPVYLRKVGPDFKLADTYPKNALIKVDGIGFGFVLMNAKKILPLYEKYGSKCFMLEEKENTGRMIGEDVIFSRHCTTEGINQWVWTDVVVGHEGGIVTERDYWARNQENDTTFKQWKELGSNPNPL